MVKDTSTELFQDDLASRKPSELSEQSRLPLLKIWVGGVSDRRGIVARRLGPFDDCSDGEGYLAATKRAAVLGYEGEWAFTHHKLTFAICWR